MTAIKKIMPAELGDFLKSHQNALVLDCRDLPDFEKEHLANAMHAPDSLIEKLVRQRDKSRPVLVYCYHGNRSRNLTELLTQFGYGNAYNLETGYTGWLEWQAKQPA